MNTGNARLLIVAVLSLLINGCRSSPSPTPAPLAPPPVSPTLTPEPTPTPVPPTPTPVPEGEVIVVDNSADSGTGTLRQALLDAQIGDTINFDPTVFPPSSPETITLTSLLPELVQSYLTIDASDAGVILEGSQISTPETVGLSIYSNNNTVRGLQILGFSKAGVALQGGAQNNTIGGDPDLGAGPLGQGNLFTGHGFFGVALWDEGTSFNTIEGNLIGTDLSGTIAVGSFSQGIFSERANHNLMADNVIGGYQDNGIGLCCVADGNNTVRGNSIGTDPSGVADLANSSSRGIAIDRSGFNMLGPGNTIAQNGGPGIEIIGDESVGNRITQNSVHNNGGHGDAFIALGIELRDGGNAKLAAPILIDFDLKAGEVTGLACAECIVEVFSDNAEEGAAYEGQTVASSAGIFALDKGEPFSGPFLTATATDANGNTSQFSVPTPNTPTRALELQLENDLPKTRLLPKRSGELEDNRIGGGWEQRWILDLGAKRASFSVIEVEWSLVNWHLSEFAIDPQQDEFVTTLADNGAKLTVTLSFWDTANHPDGWEEGPAYSRFRTEEEIERYLEFVRFVVRHFKGRVDYFELWNEPDNQGFPVQYIRIPDYINLVQRVVPVIRQENPDAKIVVGSVSNLQYTQNYLFGILTSEEIMPLVDVIAWHPFYGASPSFGYSAQFGDPREYYYGYPSIVKTIKDTAEAHGFDGEYYVDEVGWPTHDLANPDQPWTYSESVAAKYYARGVVMHLGMNTSIEVGGMSAAFVIAYTTVQNLSTVFAGADTDSLSVEIEIDAANIRSYSFELPGGDKLVALWTDGAAVEFDPGLEATLYIPGFSADEVRGIDILHGFEQELIAGTKNGGLVITNLLVKDYPVVIRLGK